MATTAKEILKSKTIDKSNPYSCKGDVATYYIKSKNDLFKSKRIKVKKFNGDYIKTHFSITTKISDGFFYLKQGGKSQLKERWIIVETKGIDYPTAFDQLSKSIDYIADANQISLRLVAVRVPKVLPSSSKKALEEIERKLMKFNGDFEMKNNSMTEIFETFHSSIIV